MTMRKRLETARNLGHVLRVKAVGVESGQRALIGNVSGRLGSLYISIRVQNSEKRKSKIPRVQIRPSQILRPPPCPPAHYRRLAVGPQWQARCPVLSDH